MAADGGRWDVALVAVPAFAALSAAAAATAIPARTTFVAARHRPLSWPTSLSTASRALIAAIASSATAVAAITIAPAAIAAFAAFAASRCAVATLASFASSGPVHVSKKGREPRQRGKSQRDRRRQRCRSQHRW